MPVITDAHGNENDGLVDRFGRVHRALRISVTDRCNIRCQYCMPASDVAFMPTAHLLSFEQILRVVSALAPVGITKIRLTGGEPLIRPDLHELVAGLKENHLVREIALTTNGMFLAQQAAKLAKAGLARVNISIDTMSEEVFQKLSRRPGLDSVLRGIQAALDAGLQVRLNAVVLRRVNLGDVVPLASFARERGLPIRFIEFMPLDADRQWSIDQMISGKEIRQIISQSIAPLVECKRREPSQPASDYEYADGQGTVGFIDSVSAPFCGACDRLRLTADGKLRNCLFGKEEWDLRPALIHGEPDSAIVQLARSCVQKKFAAHGISESDFQPPDRAMYQIGG
jgi:GTP 3',8-cyclase